MATRLAAALLAAVLLAACDPKNVAGSDAASPGPDAAPPAGLDAAARPDAATVAGPPDAAYRCAALDAATPTGLESLCADLVAGESALSLRTATECGEPLKLEDMVHLRSALIDGCEPGSRRESDLRRIAASIASGRVRLDAAKQAACRALGEGDDAGSPLDDGGTVVEPCKSMIVGLVAVGGACGYDEECAPGSWCRLGAAGSCQGACVASLKEGAPCAAITDHCEPGTWCLPAPGDAGGASSCMKVPDLGEACSDYCMQGSCEGGVCVLPVPAKEGEPCQSGGCAEGLTCAGLGDAGTGTCRPLAKEGEACGGGEPACAACLRCSSGTSRCAKVPAVGDPCAADAGSDWFDTTNLYCGPDHTLLLQPRTGEPCTRASGCLYQDDFCSFASDSAADGACRRKPGLCEACGGRSDLSPSCRVGHCEVGPRESTGACAPFSVEGEPCDRVPCAAGLSCEGGVCRGLPTAAGAACSEQLTCGAGLYCASAQVDGGVARCAAQQPGGAACASNAECLSGSCASGQCSEGACVESQIAKGCWMGSAFEYFGFVVFFAAVLRRRRAQ